MNHFSLWLPGVQSQARASLPPSHCARPPEAPWSPRPQVGDSGDRGRDGRAAGRRGCLCPPSLYHRPRASPVAAFPPRAIRSPFSASRSPATTHLLLWPPGACVRPPQPSRLCDRTSRLHLPPTGLPPRISRFSCRARSWPAYTSFLTRPLAGLWTSMHSQFNELMLK